MCLFLSLSLFFSYRTISLLLTFPRFPFLSSLHIPSLFLPRYIFLNTEFSLAVFKILPICILDYKTISYFCTILLHFGPFVWHDLYLCTSITVNILVTAFFSWPEQNSQSFFLNKFCSLCRLSKFYLTVCKTAAGLLLLGYYLQKMFPFRVPFYSISC